METDQTAGDSAMTDYRALADYTAIHQRVAGWPVWLAGVAGWAVARESS